MHSQQYTDIRYRLWCVTDDPTDEIALANFQAHAIEDMSWLVNELEGTLDELAECQEELDFLSDWPEAEE